MSTTSDARPLVEHSAKELARQIAAGEVSSAEAVEACIERIEQTAGDVNAMGQPLFDQARADARRADAARAAGEPLGPLGGVPVSIKDCFAVRGAVTTLGIPRHAKAAAASDAPIVARLRAAGAVILGKTNVPQAMLIHECASPLYGRTNLPGRPDRSPGGSTGGEAALVAAGGSPLGLGSDLGGSIRQPAAACGLFGFKPTPGRLPIEGTERAISRGMQAIAIQPGPMTRSMDDLLLGLRVMHDADEPWPEIDSVDVSKLRIAVWSDDGLFRPAAGLRRAVDRAAKALRDAGAEVIEAAPPGVEDMFRIYVGLLSSDAMASVRRVTRGGPVDPQLARQMLLSRLPRWARVGLSPLLRMTGQPELAELLTWSGARSALGYWDLVVEADAYRRRFWSRLAEAAGGPVDAVVSPPFGLPALRHGTALHLLRAASHTFLANMVGAPAGIVPAGEISKADEAEELAARPASRWNLTSRFAHENAQGSAGLPLAVEVMAPQGEDETALAVMALLGASWKALGAS